MDPTGIADSALAVQAALNGASAWGGQYELPGSVDLPAGTFRVEPPPLWRAPFGTLRGAGKRATRLRAFGQTGAPALVLRNGRSACVEALTIDAMRATDACVELLTDTTADLRDGLNLGNTGNRLADLLLLCRGLADHGVSLRKAAGSADQGNDLHTIERVEVDGAAMSSFRINQGEAKGIAFRDCWSSGAPRGVESLAGSWHWSGGWMRSHSVADFDMSNLIDPCTISDLQSESSKRFVLAPNATGNTMPLTITGVRWSADAMHADRRFIDIAHAGPVTIIGCTFGQGSQAVPKIRMTNPKASLTLIGNVWGSSGSDVAEIVELAQGVRLTAYGNTFRDASQALRSREGF